MKTLFLQNWAREVRIVYLHTKKIEQCKIIGILDTNFIIIRRVLLDICVALLTQHSYWENLPSIELLSRLSSSNTIWMQ